MTKMENTQGNIIAKSGPKAEKIALVIGYNIDGVGEKAVEMIKKIEGSDEIRIEERDIMNYKGFDELVIVGEVIKRMSESEYIILKREDGVTGGRIIWAIYDTAKTFNKKVVLV